MNKNANGQRGGSPAEIQEWIRRYRASGQGLRRFAEQHGISPSRMHYWVYHSRVARANQSKPALAGFRELRFSTPPHLCPWALEIGLPQGLVVRCRGDVSPSWVGALVKTLQTPCSA
ncbi:MAG: IS66 family insertion sequence element accessory protein TnpA [Candidatus Nanopelagicales bacterium]